ncbi:hypothetical protein ACFOUV_09120 [Oceanobacillus longus]|uniref:DUF3278 domain-containing protein n=1 Tax=Oceanobacillus longus TaxID=930120 RepID=A0ABV8H0Q3_9BACI
MIQSFLNIFLPDDEYKRMKIVYIMAEATFLTTGILMLFSFLNLNWFKWSLDGSLIMFLIAAFIMCYTFMRYIFSGIEHTDVSNENDYSTRRRKSLKNSLRFGLIFFVASFVIKGVPSGWVEAMDIIGPSILVIIFHYLFDYISLKRSYKKNKDVIDD